MRLVGGLCAVAVALVTAPAASAGIVAFSSDRCPEAYMEGCSKSLWTVEDDGTNLTRVTGPAHQAPPNESSFDDMPSWSPDGRFLLYRRDIFGRAGQHSLWITSLDGASRFQVGPEAPNATFGSYDEAEWSPDGRWIVFNGRPADAPRTTAGNGWSAIWLMSSDGAVLRRLTSGSDGNAAIGFSPDGRRIAYVGRAGPDDARPALLTMDLDGTDVAPVFVGRPPETRDPRSPRGALSVNWSPDGRDFALGYRENLYTLRSDGSELTWRGSTGSPTSIGAAFSQLAWSAEPAPALIYALPMAGSPLQRVELTGPPAPARPLTPPVTDPYGPPNNVGDDDPDWRPSTPAPPPPETVPPVALPVDLGAAGRLAARSSQANGLRVRKRRLGLLGIDPSGVRRVDVAIARRVGSRRANRCRFAGRRGLGAPRHCSRRAWRAVRTSRDLTRLVRRLRPARYELRVRAADGLGNRTQRPRLVRLRLLR